MTKNVYLCGPISGTTYDECAVGWRQDVYEALTPWGIKVWSPMRGKDHLKGWDVLGPHGYEGNPISTQQAIIGRDRYDTFNADLLFVNLIGASIVSIGSMVEIGWADAKRVPILLCMEKDGSNIHDHAFIKGLASYWVDNVAVGTNIARILLTPGI